MAVRFLSSGDTTLLVEFGTVIDRTLNDRVLQLRAAIHEAALAGVVETSHAPDLADVAEHSGMSIVRSIAKI